MERGSLFYSHCISCRGNRSKGGQPHEQAQKGRESWRRGGVVSALRFSTQVKGTLSMKCPMMAGSREANCCEMIGYFTDFDLQSRIIQIRQQRSLGTKAAYVRSTETIICRRV